MFRMSAALTIIAVSVLVGACSQTSPTAPTPAADGVVVGGVSQETPTVPASIVPVPSSALGATRFLSFGDSITAGVESQFDGMFLFDSPAAAYPINLQGMLNRDNLPRDAFVVINSGRPGEAAYQAQGRLTSELTQQRPQVLLLLQGINDMIGSGRSATEAAASVAALVDTARIFNCTVLVATMPQTFRVEEPRKENAVDRIVPFNDELRRRVSGRQNVYVVDLYEAFGRGNDRSLIGGDGLHPTPAGYARMAQAYHARIQQVFPVRGSLQ